MSPKNRKLLTVELIVIGLLVLPHTTPQLALRTKLLMAGEWRSAFNSQIKPTGETEPASGGDPTYTVVGPASLGGAAWQGGELPNVLVLHGFVGTYWVEFVDG